MDFVLGFVQQQNTDLATMEGYGESWRAFAAYETDIGLYGKVGYEDGRFRLLGQPYFGTSSITAGLGYRYEFNDTFSLYVEGGYWQPASVRLTPAIQDEITFNYLVGRHTIGGNKPIPLPQVTLDDGRTDYAPCNDWGGQYFPDQCYDSEAEIGGSPYAEIGASVALRWGFEATVSYRYLRPETYMAIFHPATKAAGGGYWEETGFLHGDTVNFGIQWRF